MEAAAAAAVVHQCRMGFGRGERIGRLLRQQLIYSTCVDADFHRAGPCG